MLRTVALQHDIPIDHHDQPPIIARQMSSTTSWAFLDVVPESPDHHHLANALVSSNERLWSP